MLRVVSLGLIASCSLSACAAQDAKAWRLDTDAIDRFIANYREQYRVPGIAVVVTNGSEIVYAKGHGHDSAGRPITATTQLPIASLSKSFTALAVMQLAEQGRLRLDDPVGRHLPDFALADPRGDRITIRQLLAHTSGMSDLTFPEKSVPTPDSLAAAVALLRQAPLAAEPGARRIYHNPNYWVAARLVEVVSGQEFSKYLEEQIFVPLQMPDTYAVASLVAAPQVENGYIRLFGRPLALPEPSWFLGGCAGVVTTAADMGRWLAFHNTGATQTGARLISDAGLNELHQGLGWNALVRDGQSLFTHSGFLFTFNARQFVLPDVAHGLGIAVMANAGMGLAPLDSDAVAQAVLAIAKQGQPSSAGPSGFFIDMILGALCVLVLLWGALSLRRSKRWAAARQDRASWRIIVSQLPYLTPIVLLALYPKIIGMIGGGRDLNWIQSLYLSLLLFALVAIGATTSAAVVLARGAALSHLSGKQAVR